MGKCCLVIYQTVELSDSVIVALSKVLNLRLSAVREPLVTNHVKIASSRGVERWMQRIWQDLCLYLFPPFASKEKLHRYQSEAAGNDERNIFEKNKAAQWQMDETRWTIWWSHFLTGTIIWYEFCVIIYFYNIKARAATCYNKVQMYSIMHAHNEVSQTQCHAAN